MKLDLQFATVQHARRWLTLGAAALVMAFSLPAAALTIADRDFAEAVKSYKAGRTSEAFGQFRDLANRGDPDAARIALFMHTHGPQLYGKHWDVLPHDPAYWAQLARNSGASARAEPAFQPLVVSSKKSVSAARERQAIKRVSATAP